MKGVTLNTNPEKTELMASIDPLVFAGSLDREAFVQYVRSTEFDYFHLSDENLLNLNDAIIAAAAEMSMDIITQTIGTLKDAPIKIVISSDQMKASITMEASQSGALPDVKKVLSELNYLGVTRGISKKRIRNLIQTTADIEAGQSHTEVVAQGLPPRRGKDSFIKPLVQNALDRILAPTDSGNNKVDMRDLGDILSVKAQQPVAKRMAPSKGRAGFTVTNKKIPSQEGDWKNFKLGANTQVAKNDENLIIATLAGQPKFENDVMSVDDSFTTAGVNVGTGNIKYDGAVVVNGDVTENMQVIAEGDITINGFVESALIRSGGDIIITQGATGKMNDEDCQLIAKGSVFVQHGQGLDVITGKNLHVQKQLAYSRVKARGSVTVGNIDNPMGNLFASNINCYNTVKAGSVGAISGSVLTIDFSEGFNLLVDRMEALTDLVKALANKNADHEIKVAAVNSRHIPAALKTKLASLNDELESERILLSWIKGALEELHDKKNAYEINARVIANKELFPGVMVKLNKKMWKGEKEYQRCRIILENGNWVYDPMV